MTSQITWGTLVDAIAFFVWVCVVLLLFLLSHDFMAFFKKFTVKAVQVLFLHVLRWDVCVCAFVTFHVHNNCCSTFFYWQMKNLDKLYEKDRKDINTYKVKLLMCMWGENHVLAEFLSIFCLYLINLFCFAQFFQYYCFVLFFFL